MQVERWGIFELALTSTSSGTHNPFTDVYFSTKFTFGHRTIPVGGRAAIRPYLAVRIQRV